MTTKRSLFKKPAWASKTIPNEDTNAPIFSTNVYEDILAADRERRDKRHLKDQSKDRDATQSQSPRPESRGTKKEEKELKRRRISPASSTLKQHAIDSDDSDGAVTNKPEEYEDSFSDSGQQDLRPVSSSRRGKTPQFWEKSRPKSKPGSRSTPKRGQGAVAESSARNDVSLLSDDEDEEMQITGSSKANARDVRLSKTATSPATNDKQNGKRPQVAVTRSGTTSDSDSESDEDLRALKQKAREEVRLKRQLASVHAIDTDVSNLNEPLTDSASPVSRAVVSETRPGTNKPDTSRATSTPAPEDPEVQILIKTIIPGTEPVIVTRRASQPLDLVKKFWCNRSGLPPEIAAKVFFMWNGIKLYNSTTMRSIIEQVRKKHGTRHDGGDLTEGRIEIEAVTQEIFELRQKQRARQRRIDAGIYDDDSNGGDKKRSNTADGDLSHDDSDDEDDDDDGEEQPQERAGIIIKLSSASIETMNLRVRPDSTIGKILSAYRTIKKLEPRLQCTLVFDGDKLDENDTVQNAGFEDEDTVEVHIKQPTEVITL